MHTLRLFLINFSRVKFADQSNFSKDCHVGMKILGILKPAIQLSSTCLVKEMRSKINRVLALFRTLKFSEVPTCAYITSSSEHCEGIFSITKLLAAQKNCQAR